MHAPLDEHNKIFKKVKQNCNMVSAHQPHPIDADNTSPVYRSMITVAYTEPVGLPPPIQYSTSVVAVTTLPL